MSVLLQVIAKFTLSPRVALEFAGMLADEVFGQSWVTATAEQEIEIDTDEIEPPFKKSKPAQDLTNVLPTRQTLTVKGCASDGYMLNFKLVAEKVSEARTRVKLLLWEWMIQPRLLVTRSMMSRLDTSQLLIRRGRGPHTQEKKLNCNGHMILYEAGCLDSLFVHIES